MLFSKMKMLEKELFNQVILLQIGAQDQSMNDNSTLALMHKIEMLVMIITQDSLQWSHSDDDRQECHDSE